MHDSFEIPVTYKDKDYNFPATLLNYGYTIKLEVDVDNTKVLFEPDEERNWRALISFEDIQANKKMDPELLKAIAISIEAITK